MNPFDGSIHELAKFLHGDDLKAEAKPLECKDGVTRNLIPVNRELTAIEQAERQIKMYSPCGCGSGEKFKFCCYRSATT